MSKSSNDLELTKAQSAVFERLKDLNSEMTKPDPDMEKGSALGDKFTSACLVVVRMEKKAEDE